ncbi:MAG TPA: MBL fold metallo-hydrolase [Burkholderiales bacterium]
MARPRHDGLTLRFLGAAGEVTGSCFLVDTGAVRFLVDCGMFQGGREAKRRNREAFAFDPRSIDFVLLTHAHIDHSGLIPRLVALGYRGPVHATRATCDLLAVMLPDSGHLQEKDAERETRHARRGRKHGREVAPLYTVQQAHDSLRRLQPAAYDDEVHPHPEVRVRFRDAGHILGSSILEIHVRRAGARKETKFVFSGDLGQPGHPIVRDPTRIAAADVLVVESTYGNRDHRPLAATLDELDAVLTETVMSGRGNVVIPAFAVGRTQDILFFLSELCRTGRACPSRIYVDSPMATAATRITLAHPELHDPETGRLTRWLKAGHGKGARVRFTENVEASMAINEIAAGAVILSASGMCDGGRIRHHLRWNLPRPECAVVFAGFQAMGTLGRRLVDGVKRVRLFGEEIPVRAKIHTIGGLSAHADRSALIDWIGGFRKPPARTFVVHGEPLGAHAFAAAIREKPGWHVEVPEQGQVARLGD